MLLACLIVFSSGLAYAAPEGVKTEGKTLPGDMVIRLVLHVQKTDNGAQLVVNLEESPDNEATLRSPINKPLLSLSTGLPLWQNTPRDQSTTFNHTLQDGRHSIKNNNTREEIQTTDKTVPKLFAIELPHVISNKNVSKQLSKSYPDEPIVTQILDSQPNFTLNPISSEKPATKKPNIFHPMQKLDFKISLGGMTANKNNQQGVRKTSPIFNVKPTVSSLMGTTKTEPITTETTTARSAASTEKPLLTTSSSVAPDADDEVTDNDTGELLDGTLYPVKAVADQGFGVLASRCASFAPGLVSDGAGGCTKPANRLKKKNYSGTYTYRSAAGNELHADVKDSPPEDLEVHVV